LAARSRKHQRHRDPSAAHPRTAPSQPQPASPRLASPQPVTQRQPVTQPQPAAPQPVAPPQPGSPGAPPASRSEARNAAVRATLMPLAAGERPWPLKVATLIALFIGVGDLGVVIVEGSFRVGDAHTAPGGVLLFSVLMLVCAWGMWQLRYWAVLAFQAILAFVILFFSLLLMRANNLLALLAAVAVVGGGGYLFYKLVRVLSRLQMPKPPS